MLRAGYSNDYGLMIIDYLRRLPRLPAASRKRSKTAGIPRNDGLWLSSSNGVRVQGLFSFDEFIF